MNADAIIGTQSVQVIEAQLFHFRRVQLQKMHVIVCPQTVGRQHG